MPFDDLVGVNECPPNPPVQAQGEHAADPDYLDLPVVAGRLADGKGRQRPGAFRQNAYKPAHLLVGACTGKRIP
jgi:hypothetical protein